MCRRSCRVYTSHISVFSRINLEYNPRLPTHYDGRSNLNSSGIGSRYKLHATRQYGNYVDEISRLAEGCFCIRRVSRRITVETVISPRNEIKPGIGRRLTKNLACFSSSLVKIVLNLDKQMWKNFNLQRIARKTAFNLFLFFFFPVENSIKS